MKNIILLCFFLFLGESIIAQNAIMGSTFSYQQISENEYNFTFNTFFSLGSPGSCPPLVDHTFTVSNDTLYVKAYYNTTGVWPMMGCARTNTVVYNSSLPPNVSYIKMSTNEITYNNTPPYEPLIITLDDIYFQVFDLSLLSRTSNSSKQNNLVYPNPTQGSIFISNDINFTKISIINNLGQIIMHLEKNTSGNYDLKNLQNGMYYLVYFSSTNEKVEVTKLMKIN